MSAYYSLHQPLLKVFLLQSLKLRFMEGDDEADDDEEEEDDPPLSGSFLSAPPEAT